MYEKIERYLRFKTPYISIKYKEILKLIIYNVKLLNI